MVRAKPARSFLIALRYWFPRRLTIKGPCRPQIGAWLWWNYWMPMDKQAEDLCEKGLG